MTVAGADLPDDEVLLALGSNMGDRTDHLETAVAALAHIADIRATSHLYETAPVGYVEQDSFLNAAVRCRIDLGPLRLFVWCKSVEFAAGRRPGVKLGPRPLDIDILVYGMRTIATARLTIPHPRLADRAFVLAPLADIAPDVVLTGQVESVAALARRAGTTGVVRLAGGAPLWPRP